jgi:hypothetical protein
MLEWLAGHRYDGLLHGGLMDPRKFALEKLLKAGETFIGFDGTNQGVIAPIFLKRNMAAVMKFSPLYRSQQGAGGCDLEVTDNGVSQTLSFGGQDFWCFIPFEAMSTVSSWLINESYVFDHLCNGDAPKNVDIEFIDDNPEQDNKNGPALRLVVDNT